MKWKRKKKERKKERKKGVVNRGPGTDGDKFNERTHSRIPLSSLQFCTDWEVFLDFLFASSFPLPLLLIHHDSLYILFEFFSQLLSLFFFCPSFIYHSNSLPKYQLTSYSSLLFHIIVHTGMMHAPYRATSVGGSIFNGLTLIK